MQLTKEEEQRRQSFLQTVDPDSCNSTSSGILDGDSLWELGTDAISSHTPKSDIEHICKSLKAVSDAINRLSFVQHDKLFFNDYGDLEKMAENLNADAKDAFIELCEKDKNRSTPTSFAFIEDPTTKMPIVVSNHNIAEINDNPESECDMEYFQDYIDLKLVTKVKAILHSGGDDHIPRYRIPGNAFLFCDYLIHLKNEGEKD